MLYYIQNMNLKINFLVFSFLFFISCNQLNDERSTILLNSEYNEWLSSKYGYQVWKPKQKDIDIVNEVLKKAIKNDDLNFIKKPILENINKHLYKQYIPYIDKKGDRIIVLNTFCQLFENEDETDWKTQHYSVEEGGFCYWRIKINIDAKSYTNLMVNGEA